MLLSCTYTIRVVVSPSAYPTLFQLLEMQKEGPKVKPKDLRHGLPESAQAVILKALAYAPKERYQSAREFGEALWDTLTGDQPDTRRAAMELGHVLFTDIVGYSKLPIDEQTKVLSSLQQIIRATAEFKRAQAGNQLIRLPTGDGMALVFFGDPEAPVRCALEISKELKNHPDIELRMGIHSGPVNKIKDVNDKTNVAGAGINMAQRVMDCGDAGHILLSKRVADDLGQYSHWQAYLHDLGEAEVKHGVRVHVFNLYTDEVGNPDLPAKFKVNGKGGRKGTFPARAALVAAITVVAITAAALFWILRPGRVAGGNKGGGLVTATANAPERTLSYWVEVQKYRDGRPDKEPFRVAGEMIFQVGDHVWFDFTSPQAGYLYVINEGPEPQNTLPQYNVLFPTPTSNNNSSALAANQTLRIPGERGFKIDDERGTEKIWVVWSGQRINDLERIAKEVVTRERHGVISEPNEIKIIQDFLKAHSAALPNVAKDEEKKLTTVEGSGDVIVTVRRLEHY